MTEIAALEARLAEDGLCLRGWLDFGLEPGVSRSTSTSGLQSPVLGNGKTARLIVLIGYVGGSIWPGFEAWRTRNPGRADPLDDWSKAVIAPIAEAAGGEAVFPSDRPWRPFQQWAMAAEGLRPSPLGMLIDPVYGLWHGYRGAMLFGASASARMLGGRAASGLQAAKGDADAMAREAGGADRHPCDACTDKPCLSACPVEAFGQDGFNVAACRAHLRTETGRGGCMMSGCLARNACPVGQKYHYSAAQIRFHMAAFG